MSLLHLLTLKGLFQVETQQRLYRESIENEDA